MFHFRSESIFSPKHDFDYTRFIVAFPNLISWKEPLHLGHPSNMSMNFWDTRLTVSLRYCSTKYWLQYLDFVANTLNNILKKLSIWCLKNSLTPHLGKTEYLLLGCPKFNGPFQEIRFGNATINNRGPSWTSTFEHESLVAWQLDTEDCPAVKKVHEIFWVFDFWYRRSSTRWWHDQNAKGLFF